MSFRQRYFAKAYAITGAQLCRYWKIDRSHVRDFWITTNRLAISE